MWWLGLFWVISSRVCNVAHALWLMWLPFLPA